MQYSKRGTNLAPVRVGWGWGVKLGHPAVSTRGSKYFGNDELGASGMSRDRSRTKQEGALSKGATGERDVPKDVVSFFAAVV